MDTLTFIAALVGSVAWPLAIVGAAIALRRPFQQLLTYMTKLKYGDLELSFDRNIQRLELKAAASLPTDAELSRPQPAISPEIARLAEESPRAAIIEAWVRLSNAAVGALKQRGATVPKGKFVAPGQIEKTLAEAGLLNVAELALLRQLRSMRN